MKVSSLSSPCSVSISFSEAETEMAGECLGKSLKKGAILALDAPLGAGKTVFVRGVARALGVNERITSPSYTILNEYEARDSLPFYHIDAWRLSSSSDFENSCGPNPLSGYGVAVIEWAAKIKDILPKSTIYVEISILKDGSRQIKISAADTAFPNSNQPQQHESHERRLCGFCCPFASFAVKL